MKTVIAKFNKFLIENNYEEQFDAELKRRFGEDFKSRKQVLVDAMRFAASNPALFLIGIYPHSFFAMTQAYILKDGTDEQKALCHELHQKWEDEMEIFVEEQLSKGIQLEEYEEEV